MEMAGTPNTDVADDDRLLLLNAADNVFVLRAPVAEGEEIVVSGRLVRMPKRIGLGHKIARRAIKAGEKVLKYGVPIGSATRDIALGEHVHIHNLKSDYTPTHLLGGERPGSGGAAQ